MGDISGLDILKENPLVPVIVMTGRSDYSDNAALKDGFIGYLPKPVNKESIREMIGEGESFADFLGDDFEEIKELVGNVVLGLLPKDSYWYSVGCLPKQGIVPQSTV